MRYFLYIAFGCVLGGMIFYKYVSPIPPIAPGQATLPMQELRLASGSLRVEVADTDKERRQGLSDRPPLTQGMGMLFVFPQPGLYPFWMKDMRFPLDIVYLNQGIIQDLFPNVPPPQGQESPKTVTPNHPADQVLEVLAGEAKRRSWTVGQPLR